jgi:hypothetical protein
LIDDPKYIQDFSINQGKRVESEQHGAAVWLKDGNGSKWSRF